MILWAMTSQHRRIGGAEERCSRNRQQLSVHETFKGLSAVYGWRLKMSGCTDKRRMRTSAADRLYSSRPPGWCRSKRMKSRIPNVKNEIFNLIPQFKKFRMRETFLNFPIDVCTQLELFWWLSLLQVCIHIHTHTH